MELTPAQYLPPPANLDITFQEDYSATSFTLPEPLSSGQTVVVVAPDEVPAASFTTGQRVTFLSQMDGMYHVTVSGELTGVSMEFYLPVIGRILACRQKLLEGALPCDKCPKGLPEGLRVVDGLLRTAQSASSIGDYLTAQGLLSLSLEICTACDCSCNGL